MYTFPRQLDTANLQVCSVLSQDLEQWLMKRECYCLSQLIQTTARTALN
jgi:hypothetical protein